MTEKPQPNQIRGELTAQNLRFGIVVSRFNSFITERLLAGALDALERAGASAQQIDVTRVPGAFEIAIAAKKMAQTGRYDAMVCIGCVLRGETTHYDYVCSESARGIQLAQMDTGVPMAFCILTCDTLEQAIDRAGLKGGNKGYDAAFAAIEMANLARKLISTVGAHPRVRPASGPNAGRTRRSAPTRLDKRSERR
jgi:6,7-dimethyl-8-ribityllumazine synthase